MNLSDVVKWWLIPIVAGTVFYIVYPNYHLSRFALRALVAVVPKIWTMC